jgi:DNA-binding transcriptional LysR family regulator
LDLAHSRALIAIGELGSFARAGERLHLSPPAVFAQVRQLEAEVGEKLYERTGRRLILTPAGRLLLEYCRRLLLVQEEAITAVKELGGMQRGSLSLGSIPHLSHSIAPHLLRAFVPRHPQLEIRLITASDAALLEHLHAGKVDVLLMNLPVDAADLVQAPLWRDELVFVVPPGETAVSSRPFILHRQAPAGAGFEPNIAMQNEQPGTIKELVKLGLGISLLPFWSVADEVRCGELGIVRVEGGRLFGVTGLVYRQSAHVPQALRALLETGRQWKTWLPRAEDVLEIEADATGGGPA